MTNFIDNKTSNLTKYKEKQLLDEDVNYLTDEAAKGGFKSFIGNCIGRFFKLLLQFVITRYLGAQLYGLYALGESMLQIFARISMAGLQNGVVRYGVFYNAKKDFSRLKGTFLFAIILSLMLSVFLSVILVFLKEWICVNIFREHALDAVLRYFVLSLPFFVFLNIIAHFARVFYRVDYDIAIRESIHSIVIFLMASFAIFIGLGIEGVVFGFFVGTVVTLILGFILLLKYIYYFWKDVKAIFECKLIFLYSITVMLSGFLQILLNRVDRLMLGFYGGAVNVGIYNVAAIIALQMLIFLESFNSIFSPMIADLFNKSCFSELGNLYKIITKWIFMLTIPFFVFVVVFNENIMLIFGSEFKGFGLVLVILAVSQLVNCSVGSAGYMLNMTEKHNLELINGVLTIALNIILNIGLIPRYGVMGAALATGFSIIIVNVLRVVEIYYLFGFHPYKFSYYKPFVAGIVCLILSYLLKKYLLIGCFFDIVINFILTFILYLGMLFVFGFDSDDDVVLRITKEKFGVY